MNKLRYKSQFIFYAFIMIIQISCTSVANRYPAEDNSTTISNLFSFPSFNSSSNKNYKEEIENKLNMELLYNHKKNGPGIIYRKIEYHEVKSLPNNYTFTVELDIDQKTSQLVYQIFHTPKAFEDKIASQLMYDFTSRLIRSSALGSAYTLFETYFNARAGDPQALKVFWKYKDLSHKNTASFVTETTASTVFEQLRNELSEELAVLNRDIRKQNAQKAIEEKKRKLSLDSLDKAAESEQFRTLVSKGDRKGVVELLNRYLPWEEMPPFEMQFWRTYLDIISKPVPLDQRVLIYRGIDDDFIHRAYKTGKELTEEEAILKSKAFVMSTILVKNQGSWNRRLRSLQAMNKKFIANLDQSIEEVEGVASTARISVMFSNHSVDPVGSPFLSFTPNYTIAHNFGIKRISSFLIDPRLLSFNYTSVFQTEIEYLVPLTTFPEDLVGIADTELDGTAYEARQALLEEKLRTLITEKYGSKKTEEVLKKIKQNSYQFFKGEYPGVEKASGKEASVANLNFYQKFLKAKDPKPTMTPDGNLDCKGLIQQFWMVK